MHQYKVLARIVFEVERCTYLVAAYGVPELSAVIDIDGVGVVFPTADSDNLLTCREKEIVGEIPVKVSPVGALEESVGEADVGRVDALAKVVGEFAADGTVQSYNQILSRETMVCAGRDGVVSQMVVDGEVSSGVQLQIV